MRSLNFGAPPASWLALRHAEPSRLSEEVKRLRLAGQGGEAKALAYAALWQHRRDGYLWAQLLQLCRDDLPMVDALRREMLVRGVAMDAHLDAVLLDAAARAGRADFAERVVAAAREEGRALSLAGYACWMQAVAGVESGARSFWVLGELRAAGLQPNARITSQLVAVAQACHRSELVEQVLRDVENRALAVDGPSLNALAAAARDLGETAWIGRVFSCCRAAGLPPSCAMYNVLIDAYGGRDGAVPAKASFRALLSAGLAPQDTTFLAMLGAYRDASLPEQAQQLLQQMPRYNVAADVRHYSVLLQAYGVAKDAAGVHQCLATMRRQQVALDAQAMTVVVIALDRSGPVAQTWHTYQALRQAGVRPNAVALDVLVDCLRRHGAVEHAAQLLGQMRRDRLVGGERAYTLLINLLGGQGHEGRVAHVFAAMREARVAPPLTAYSAAISAAGATSDVAQVRQWVDAMRKAGLSPDRRTISAICHAYHRAGRRNPSLYAQGAAVVEQLHFGVAAYPDVADLLRRAHAFGRALQLCEQALLALPNDDPQHHYAWIVALYCRRKGDSQQQKDLAAPPFDQRSPQWLRYLCATVFFGALQQPASEVAATLRRALEEAQNAAPVGAVDPSLTQRSSAAAGQTSRNEGSLIDLESALELLEKAGKTAAVMAPEKGVPI